MTISQLNGTNSSPVPPLTTTARKIPGSSTENAASVAPTIGSKIGNVVESAEQVKQAVQKIQGTVNNLAQNLQFSIDEDTGKTIIKVMDVHTEEVIRQIPTEEAVKIARTLDKVQGLLFNGKA
ncbi:MAG: flagellar biosynthesis protein FlaG [Proteobacteria bacterium SG_bin4]|nr:MAG: flagellar biosynthesis protein FlaG [Proteobacteria bacterium SG_bin4]